MKLVGLFDCRYRSGRAASAPQTRTTSGSKVTMAEANALEQTCVPEGPDELDPEMPHLLHGADHLRLLFPPLVVHDDEHAEPDLADDDADGIMVEGERLARDIMEEAKVHGRRRRAQKLGKVVAQRADLRPRSSC